MTCEGIADPRSIFNVDEGSGVEDDSEDDLDLITALNTSLSEHQALQNSSSISSSSTSSSSYSQAATFVSSDSTSSSSSI
jgi:hypothetical protein